MGKLSSGVQRRKRDGTSLLVIDFRFRDKDGREQRYRRDARVQTRAGAEAEARRLMEIAHATGTLELRGEAPTLRVFVEETFKPLYRTKVRPGTWRRYEGLLRQGLLDELGDKLLPVRGILGIDREMIGDFGGGFLALEDHAAPRAVRSDLADEILGEW